MRTWEWGRIKLELHRQLQISDDALHVHVGLILLFATAFVLRRPPWSRWPVLVVAVVEAGNEVYDTLSLGPINGETAVPDGLHDFALTMLWPVALLVLVPVFQRATRRR